MILYPLYFNCVNKMNDQMTISQITNESWSDILGVQEEAYTGLPPEDISVLKSKWSASPETCFIAKTEDEVIQGYLLAHPWNSDEPPKLFEALPIGSGGPILYLHDLAISSGARAMGVGKQLSRKLLDIAKSKGFEKVLLVAVQGSEGFWSGLGFNEIPNVPVCSSYGSNAILMELKV